MSSKFMYHISITRFAASVLLPFCLFQLDTAQGSSLNDDEVLVFFLSGIPLGVAPGQTLRASLVNLIKLEGRQQDPVEVSALLLLYDAQGIVIAQTRAARVAIDEIGSFDVSRDGFSLPGDPATGLVPVRPVLEVHIRPVSKVDGFTIKQRVNEFLLGSLELIEETGKTSAWHYRPQRVGGTIFQLGVDLQQTAPVGQTRQITVIQDMAPIGLTFGQSLTYTWANNNDPDPQKRDLEPVQIRVKVLAPNGSVLAQNEAPAVGAGQFQLSAFNRNQWSLPGEDITGRLQVRLEVAVVYRTTDPNIALKEGVFDVFPDTLTIVNNDTGRTTLLAGKTALDVKLP